ncbi:MAG TPA: hypothetical protein VL172_11645 [Kofleriaceae bacterium]|nr:hypothetical protein [Kofleriaceae bacterium]
MLVRIVQLTRVRSQRTGGDWMSTMGWIIVLLLVLLLVGGGGYVWRR